MLAICLPVLLVLGQACTGCTDGALQFSSAPQQLRSGGGGDGEPFDNKPTPGTYYRTIPGFQCNGTGETQGKAEVTATTVTVTSKVHVDGTSACTEETNTYPLTEADHSRLFPELIGVKEGIYERLASAPNPARLTVPVVEALCRLEAQALEVRVTQELQTGRLVASVMGARNDSGLWRLSEPLSVDVGRNLGASRVAYSSGDFSLDFVLPRKGTADETNGRLKVTYGEQRIEGDVVCRSGAVIDPVAAVPVFSVDFGGGVLPAGASFARASAGTHFDAQGSLVVASAGSPRFDHDPVTGLPLGLLLESRRTNLLRQSTNLADASAWSSNIPGDIETTPEGQISGLMAYRIQRKYDGAGAVWEFAAQTVNVVAGTTYTLSFFAKSGNVTGARAIVWIRGGDEANVDFDLTNGTSTLSYENIIDVTSNTVVPVRGGYRVITTFTSSETTAVNVGIGPLSSKTDDFIFATGAQLEAGATVSSFIPTTTASLARESDSLVTSEVSWFNPAAGTLQAYVTRPAAGASFRAVSLQGANGDYSLSATGASLTAQWTVSGATTQTPFANNLLPGAFQLQNAIFTYGDGPATVSLNGALASSSGVVATGLSPQQLQFGAAGEQNWNAHVRSLVYWAERLDDKTIQLLSPD